ncbi:MAG: M20 family metallo-hydrolase [Thermoplasmata archaeon]|nr:MAG: M20 family metallo-hydrolase [Thermoplasmata archaeon]
MSNEVNFDEVYAKVDELKDEIIESLMKIVRVPAIGPKSGGDGELKKAQLIEEMIQDFGFDEITHYDAPDDSVPSGIRPNIIAKVNGTDPSLPPIWVMSHTDIVPTGDLKLWDTDPFEPVIKEGRIYGRGVEDNGQELIASIYAVKVLKLLGLKPKHTIGLALVADEETGSAKGLHHIINEKIFKPTDLIVVPDGGNEEGTLMEVSEKSIMWVKVTTLGKQCHASMPDKGINAFRAASIFAVKADEMLKSTYGKVDELFDPPTSTFEMTKKEANVPNVNTIPGEDTFYFDCRILPDYSTEDALGALKKLVEEVSSETGAKIELELVQHDPAAPPTAPDAPVVNALKQAIEKVYNNEPYPGGIGGGTCAAIFRRAGYPAVVWGTMYETAHSPNEFVEIDFLINDTKVFCTLFLSD